MCQVSRTTLVAWQNVKIPAVSEFDEIRRGSKILQDDSNSEVRFVIQDLEKFRILTEITILPFFRKLEFCRVLHSHFLIKGNYYNGEREVEEQKF